MRAYKADWTHFSARCAAHGFTPVPATSDTVGAYLASLAETHAPTTIRRRLSAIGKMHRFNDLAWNPAHRVAMAGLTVEGFERLSAHALRVGFITEAYDKGVRDEDIMRHTRHRDLRTMRGYVQRAGLVSESPAGQLDL